MKKILILKPNLHSSFKEGPIHFGNDDDLPPIRKYWSEFVWNVEKEHIRRGDNVKVLEKPLWQFDPTDVIKYDPDTVYIPHKESHNFPVPIKNNPMYYMQTVFPDYFTIDSKGWGGGLSGGPIMPSKETSPITRDILYNRVDNNISKFIQAKPKKHLPWKNFVLFTCQLPHDETIKYHSDIGVEQALKEVLNCATPQGGILVVKGHVVNPQSQIPLQKLTEQYTHAVWTKDEYSIHDLIRQSNSVITVNSGTGIEALLHYKPVYIFGEAEYSSVVHRLGYDTEPKKVDKKLYNAWFNSYIDFCYQSINADDFRKLP